MTQPARGYQPYQPMAPMMAAPTPPKQSRGGLTTLLAGVLALVVAGLAVGGSFGAITEYRNSYRIDDDPSVYATTTTWWGFHDAGSSSPIEEESVLAGLTLVLAGALLLLGAVFAFVASRTRTSGPVAGSRSLISAGVGVLTGVTVLQLFAVLKQMERYNEQELDAGESLEFTAGLGLWLPLGGVVLGVIAAVLAHVGQRPAAARVEPNTPRMGFPAPYGYRPQAPAAAERVTEVQISDEDAAADTQVVSEATVSGADAQAPAAPAAPAPVTPPAPVVPPAPVAPPVTPATTSLPEAPTSPAVGAPTPPAEPTAPATSSTEAPATPAAAPASSPAEPADAAAAPEPETAPPADDPAKPEAAPEDKPSDKDEDKTAESADAGKPTPLSELPAAPPAPELSSPDEPGKADK